MRTADLSEGSYCVVLPDFQSYARTCCQLFRDCWKFRNDTFVNLEELLSSGSIKPKHLHCTDLESLSKDEVDDGSGTALCKNMWFDDATSAIVEECRALQLP